MQRANASGTRRSENGMRRWLPVAAALAIALVALMAVGSVDPASAAAHPKHTTAKATKAPAFPLDFTCAQAWNTVLGVVCVKTQPGAALTIGVTACGRVVHDAGLKGTVHADDKGQYAWNWTPNTTCRMAKATVTAKSGGKTVKKSTTFRVEAVPSASVSSA
jgi:hypothetical protein